ncbi:MAG: hypothetical protein EZS28_005752 [Streblomastix strix]|uniref:Uncharacterized protein n=1 Tax=Streblomastix strix TaxID=222440 RepID=A0A5J4WV04_9EUKA|nr:MAG: hypothetical protein EZS28_005752 [Streblomastix strix]
MFGSPSFYLNLSVNLNDRPSFSSSKYLFATSNIALIATSDTHIIILKGATANFTTSNVFDITEGKFDTQGGTFIHDSIELAMIKATNATVTFGENTTSKFVAVLGLSVIQGNLNIFKRTFTYKKNKTKNNNNYKCYDYDRKKLNSDNNKFQLI